MKINYLHAIIFNITTALYSVFWICRESRVIDVHAGRVSIIEKMCSVYRMAFILRVSIIANLEAFARLSLRPPKGIITRAS